MPGVATAEVRYDTSFDGGAHFDLTATLTPTAEDDQGAAVARTFVDKVAAANFAHFDVTFELRYRHAGTVDIPASTTDTSSTLRTEYSFDDPAVMRPERSPDAVAAATKWWLDIARSPAVDTVTVTLPLHDRYSDVTGPNLHVQIPLTADDTTLTDLITAHPQLNSASWDIVLPGRDPYSPANSYSTVGLLLDHKLRQTWQHIVDNIRPIDHAEASTTVPPKRNQPPTEATLTLAFDHGRQRDF
ncbi:MAG: hypothetical protein PHQ28_06880, partial [Mycobacterium sp.]|nr:hypothetical protein [Mycobacterium sp.]